MNTDSADKSLRSTELCDAEFTEPLRENLTDLKKERKGTAIVVLGGPDWDFCPVHLSLWNRWKGRGAPSWSLNQEKIISQCMHVLGPAIGLSPIAASRGRPTLQTSFAN